MKQPEVPASTNDMDVRKSFKRTKFTMLYPNVLALLGLPQPDLTQTHEDNAVTISQVIKDY